MSKEMNDNMMWLYRGAILLVLGIASWSIKNDVEDFKTEFKEMKTATINTATALQLHAKDDDNVKDRVVTLEAAIQDERNLMNRNLSLRSK